MAPGLVAAGIVMAAWPEFVAKRLPHWLDFRVALTGPGSGRPDHESEGLAVQRKRAMGCGPRRRNPAHPAA